MRNPISFGKPATFLKIPIEQILPNPQNARSNFDDAKVEELAMSIEKEGLINPITVREVLAEQEAEVRYQVVAGDTRLRAIKILGWAFVDVMVVPLNDAEARLYSLAENIHRQDLNDVEKGQALIDLRSARTQQLNDSLERAGVSKKDLLSPTKLKESLDTNPDMEPWLIALITHAIKIGRKPKVSWDVIADAVGWSVPRIEQLTAVTKLPPDLQKLVVSNKISSKNALKLKKLSPQELTKFLAENESSDLSGRQIQKKYKEIRDARISNSDEQDARAPGPPEHTYGPPLSFRGIQHEPLNELGTVLLFGIVAKDLGFIVESVRAAFPDCEAKRYPRDPKTGVVDLRKGKRVRIEFEWKSQNFLEHGHDASQCNMIVCWEHNWLNCPESLEVVELKKEILTLSS